LPPMPEFLTGDEAAAYGRYAAAPTRAELEKVFFLDYQDRDLIARRRGDHMKFGFALQLVTVRHVGMFLADPLDVPGDTPSCTCGRSTSHLRIVDPLAPATGGDAAPAAPGVPVVATPQACSAACGACW